MSDGADRTSDAAGPEAVGFPPTLREVMLRPRWIAMLLLCLVVAGVFAWLGQWQLGRALQTSPVDPGATEHVRPLSEVVGPGEYLGEPLVGQRVRARGTWVPGDFLVVQSRVNAGVEGYWVTGQLRLTGTEAPTSLAVAIGWAGTLEEARTAALQLEHDLAPDPFDLTGRLISDEGPALPPRGSDPRTMTRMSPAALLSQWHDTAGVDVYRAYLAAEVSQGPLLDIVASPPGRGAGLNWLNVFYAVEWAVFAGFAFYLWYRLARDAWERELEEPEDADAAASASSGGASAPGD